MEYGIFEGYFVLSVGEGGLEELLTNSATPAPTWIAEITTELPIERTAGIFRWDLTSLHALAQANGEVPPQLHLEEFQSIIGTMGLEDGETVSRIALHCPKKLQGILKAFEATPLTIEEISAAPAGVNNFFAAKFQPQTIWEILNSIDDMRDEIDEFTDAAKTNIDLDFEGDVINSFDELIYSYQQLSLVNPASSGVLALRIKNPEQFAKRLDDIADSINERGEAVDIEFEESKTGTIYKLQPYDLPPALSAISACCQLVGNELVFAADPKAIGSHIRKLKRTTGKLVEDDRLLKFFDNSQNGGLGQPIALQYFDTSSFLSIVYSVLPMIAQGPLAEAGIDFDELPELNVIINGIKPDIVGVYRTDRGFQIMERTTLPGLTTATPVAIGLMLPAVQQARQAARRVQSQNNIRQLLLANLNHESAWQAFPPAYTSDNDGNKLLSWRVQILPFLEETELYEKFHLDEPWDSPHNKALIAEMPATFQHPALDLEPGLTVYLGATGEDAIFERPENANNGEQDKTGTGFSGDHGW